MLAVNRNGGGIKMEQKDNGMKNRQICEMDDE